MKLFIDTANIDEIREINDWGVICGVTTNPSLIAKEGRDFKEVIKEISTIVDGPISAEVISLESHGMVEEARELAKIHKNIIIKIPMTKEGLKAVKVLDSEGIKTNVTLVFSPSQALLGGLLQLLLEFDLEELYEFLLFDLEEELGNEGINIIEDIVKIYNNYNISTEVIAASVRHPMHVLEAAKAGSHIATIPYKVFEQMVKHPMTDLGIERFLKDWEGVDSK